jgi:hypothetical protein
VTGFAPTLLLVDDSRGYIGRRAVRGDQLK